MVHEIEQFFGVYILYNINPKFKGRTYIGFTVNPNRRIQQHNKGKQAGGAWRTHGRGPWEMVLIIHGFPNEISALRFEWAWQHPDKSRRLRHLPKKKTKERPFDYRFRIVSEMLRTGPWKRLPLTVRWLKQAYVRDFAPDCQPPLHMPIEYGPVKIKNAASTGRGKKKSKTTEEEEKDASNEGEDLEILSQVTKKRCGVCRKKMQEGDTTLQCIHPKCQMVSHIICLSKKFLSDSGCPDQILPVEGVCPRCSKSMLWGDLLRLKKGCYQNLVECNSSGEDEDQDHWTNQLHTQVAVT